ncbi:hypothetical protein BU26DRAFT_312986 [Trematosphaeria pertusa]|uniref:Secreted protein n=1 Tax=Trematosphaeria pertusa TaxID=390896 RepID=A0A6A6IGX8_9PLEO|nr:uncharacterized protein BU26DRAFT_312986 [Trematosphaeria pertusa]KAF2249142.1 hypothetical protein BU26DRAFT_312986 [Trematosphaeria pertusa]
MDIFVWSFLCCLCSACTHGCHSVWLAQHLYPLILFSVWSTPDSYRGLSWMHCLLLVWAMDESLEWPSVCSHTSPPLLGHM